MEKVYRKVGRKYVEVGYNDVPDLSDGIWLVQSKPSSKSTTSLVWKVGDIKRPVDIVTRAGLYSMSEKLSQYLVKLTDENSDEYMEAKKKYNNWIQGPIYVSNISAFDLCDLLLSKMGEELDEGIQLKWGDIMFKFREQIELHDRKNFNECVRILYQFIDWLEKNGYSLKHK